jgi:hypothetical protein
MTRASSVRIEAHLALPVIAFGPGAHKKGSIKPLCGCMPYGF